MIDAGQLIPSTDKYVVIYTHNHKTLKVGDVVVMSESPTYENILIREKDMTLHRLTDEFGQYVHLSKVEE